MKQYILGLLGETSTYKAILVVLTLFGVSISPEQSEAILKAGASVYAAIGLFLRDKIKGE